MAMRARDCLSYIVTELSRVRTRPATRYIDAQTDLAMVGALMRQHALPDVKSESAVGRILAVVDGAQAGFIRPYTAVNLVHGIALGMLRVLDGVVTS